MISVALCTYNGEKFLDQQLNSILNQSKPIDEVVICDDLSKDDTISIIKKFQIDFPSIIKLHINEVSLGAIKNFEKAISLCSGDIIFLSDQDDIWTTNKVEKIIKKFTDNPKLEAVFTDAELIDGNGKLLQKTLFNEYTFNLDLQKEWANGKALLDLIYYRNKITGATMAFKKELFNRVFPFTKIDNFWHDAYLGLHAAANDSLGWINEPLTHYRIHNNQQIGIGNGTTIKNEAPTPDLKTFLTNMRPFFVNCLFIISNELQDKYPNIEKNKLEAEAVDWITFIDFRLKLPNNIFTRVTKIFNNLSNYRTHSNFPFKSMLRDAIIPCK